MKRRVILFHIEGEKDPIAVSHPIMADGLPPPLNEPKSGVIWYTATGSYRVLSLQKHHSPSAWYVDGERVHTLTVGVDLVDTLTLKRLEKDLN